MIRDRFLISFLIALSLFLCRTEKSVAKNNCVDCSGFKRISKIEDLNDYDFVIHIKVIKSALVKNNLAKLSIKTIQIFKGNHLNTVYESDKNTSFEIGIMPGEEWVIFGNKIGAKNTITGGCYHHFKYRNKDGLIIINQKGGDELENLKRICGVFPSFVRDTCIYSYYPNGSIEKEEFWKNGMLNGKRKLWYPDKSPRLEVEFQNDTLIGTSRNWLPTGQLRDSTYFNLGQEQFSIYYFDTSDSYQTEFHHIIKKKLNQGSKIENYNNLGNLISEDFEKENESSVHIEYDSLGGIKKITSNYFDQKIDKSDNDTTPEVGRKLKFETNEKPELFIGSTNMNIIYLGIQNQLAIVVNGIRNEKLYIESSQGTISKNSKTSEYSLLINSTSTNNRIATVKAYYIDSIDSKILIGEKDFRIRQIPNPIPMVGPIEQSGLVSIGQIRSANFFLLPMKDFPYAGLSWKPVSYTVTILPKFGKKKLFFEKDVLFSKELKSEMNKLKSGDQIIFSDIIGFGPNGEKTIDATLKLKVNKPLKH